jgi:hypothetical protein
MTTYSKYQELCIFPRYCQRKWLLRHKCVGKKYNQHREKKQRLSFLGKWPSHWLPGMCLQMCLRPLSADTTQFCGWVSVDSRHLWSCSDICRIERIVFCWKFSGSFIPIFLSWKRMPRILQGGCFSNDAKGLLYWLYILWCEGGHLWIEIILIHKEIIGTILRAVLPCGFQIWKSFRIEIDV